MLNKVILTGRLTAKPELKTTRGGVSVARFTAAVQRNYKNADGEYDTDFIPIVAWRKTAEFAAGYFEKGQLISVAGTLQSRQYEDKDGNKRTAYEVNADEVLFAQSKRTEDTQPTGQAPTFEELSVEEDLPF